MAALRPRSDRPRFGHQLFDFTGLKAGQVEVEILLGKGPTGWGHGGFRFREFEDGPYTPPRSGQLRSGDPDPPAGTGFSFLPEGEIEPCFVENLAATLGLINCVGHNAAAAAQNLNTTTGSPQSPSRVSACMLCGSWGISAGAESPWSRAIAAAAEGRSWAWHELQPPIRMEVVTLLFKQHKRALHRIGDGSLSGSARLRFSTTAAKINSDPSIPRAGSSAASSTSRLANARPRPQIPPTSQNIYAGSSKCGGDDEPLGIRKRQELAVIWLSRRYETRRIDMVWSGKSQ